MAKKKTGKEKINLMNLFKHPLGFEGIDEILTRTVVAIGNGAHINIPLKHLHKEATITIKAKKEEDKKK